MASPNAGFLTLPVNPATDEEVHYQEVGPACGDGSFVSEEAGDVGEGGAGKGFGGFGVEAKAEEVEVEEDEGNEGEVGAHYFSGPGPVGEEDHEGPEGEDVEVGVVEELGDGHGEYLGEVGLNIFCRIGGWDGYWAVLSSGDDGLFRCEFLGEKE